MLSDLRKRKLAKLFHIWDTNHDGLIERADFLLVALRVAELSGSLPGSDAYRTIQAGYLQSWEIMCQTLDKDLVAGEMNLDEYLLAQEVGLADQTNWERYVREYVLGLANRVDKDHDGLITLAEFTSFACAYGIGVDIALKAAQSFDHNQDGFIRIDDIVRYLEEFYYSDDPAAPGNNFAGLFG